MFIRDNGMSGAVGDWLKDAAKDIAEAGKEALKSRISQTGQIAPGGVPIIIGPQPDTTPSLSPAMKYGMIGVGALLVAGVVIALVKGR